MPAVVAPYHHEDRPSCVECLVSSFNVVFMSVAQSDLTLSLSFCMKPIKD